MTASDVLDLRGVAAQLGVTYDWFQRHWRTLDGFPPPYLGGGKGQRPRWLRAAVIDYQLGRRWTDSTAPATPLSAGIAPANDPAPMPMPDRASALLAYLG